LKLVDIEAVSEISKAHNIPLAVDNTFLTAALQRPFELGADIVLYSTTKYIEGHNSTVGGALLSNNEKYVEEFRFVQNATGNIMSPFPAWLTLQGIKTLSLRIKQHSLNALQVAEYLESHPKIENVAFPGLKSFPQYELAKKQQSDFGGMLCFEVKGGFENGIKLLNSTTLCTLAENLGVIETLITHPASMTHAPIPKEDRLKIGITEGLVRLSVGLEDVRDIIEDLDNALALI
jgi:cystathionine beta-lyase/cystathionine gamma-synthase